MPADSAPASSPAADERPFWIIANPVSGGGRGERAAKACAAALRERGLSVALHFTRPDRLGAAIAADANATNCRALVAVGGDGSLNDVLNGLRDAQVPIGLVPAGTANVWARAANLPRDPAAAAAILAADHRIETRVATARIGGDRHRFLLFVGSGLDARLVRTVEVGRRSRGGVGGMRHWWRPAIRELMRPRGHRPRLSVTIGEHTHDGLMHVLVTRIHRYAGLLSLPDSIRIEDGRMHVVGFRRAALWRFAPRIWRSLRGRLRVDDIDVYAATTDRITIRSESPEPCHVDGDDRGDLPVEVDFADSIDVQLIVPGNPG